MVDSIVLIQKLYKLDFKYLKELGITVSRYQTDKSNTSVAGSNIYSLYYDYGYIFEYKTITFKYCVLHNYLLIITHADKILNKDVITVHDKEPFKIEVIKIYLTLNFT